MGVTGSCQGDGAYLLICCHGSQTGFTGLEDDKEQREFKVGEERTR